MYILHTHRSIAQYMNTQTDSLKRQMDGHTCMHMVHTCTGTQLAIWARLAGLGGAGRPGSRVAGRAGGQWSMNAHMYTITK